MVLKLPEILDVPSKLLPIIERFNDYRYFLLEGGRGGGKTHTVGRFILFLAEKYNVRTVCGRETQNTISESVYAVLADLIRHYNLDFEVQATSIQHRKKVSPISFRGFRQQGAFNIQGMEGIDLLWIDEAQAITKQTLDVLLPTIRKDNAKIFFTMNRHVENDPVFAAIAGRPDCLHIHINYHDNPFCTNALKIEAEACRKVSESDYRHIWLGEPLGQTEDAVYTKEELDLAVSNIYPLRDGYGIRIAGFDVARYGDDKCAAQILQQMGALHWATIFTDGWGQKDLNYTTGRILSIHSEQNVDKSIVDEDGIGSGPLDSLTKGRGIDSFVGFRNPVISYENNKDYANPRTVNAYKLKDMLMKGHIHIPHPKTIAELKTIKYTFDHHQRRILVSKEQMRKQGVASPNLADALIMAVSLTGQVQQKQAEPYRPRANQYAKEESLFQIAGVR